MRAGAVIVAAGSGARFGAGTRKQYQDLGGAPLLSWAVRPFVDHPAVREVAVVLPREDAERPPPWIQDLPVTVVAGGAQRSDSVRHGLAALTDDCEVVLVHDGARPLASRELVDRVLDAAREGVAVVPGVPVTDTLKDVADDGFVRQTIDRRSLWRAQTPQAFPLATLRRLHEQAHRDGVSVTDDAALFERHALQVRVVEGDPDNLKVTTPADLRLARLLARELPRTAENSERARRDRTGAG